MLKINAESILVTGGIGDWMALEYFFPASLRAGLRHVFYATPVAAGIRELQACLPNYPRLESQTDLWWNFTSLSCFTSRQQLMRLARPAIARVLPFIHDFSIAARFPLCRLGANTSSLLAHRLADVPALPGRFYALCPYSNHTVGNRNFTSWDWKRTVAILEERGTPGVVINVTPGYVPSHRLVINLTGKTSLPESVEVLKRAAGFIGTSSCLSVLAAKLFPADKLLVRAPQADVYRHALAYYAPHTSYPFLVKSLAGYKGGFDA